MRSYIVDAFTSEAFKGNPAAVCFAGQDLSYASMLSIAKEFGLSETAFLTKTDRPGTYLIRYFSPKQEIPLCGHATLASAKVIFNGSAETALHFITDQQVDLYIKKKADAITMEFPVYATTAISVPPVLLAALGLEAVIDSVYSEQNKILLLQIKSAQVLADLAPDFTALVQSYTGINGVLVTAAGEDSYDYHYRYFWPWAGTNEDPVTGGVQTFLAKYWSDRLNKNILQAFQCSARTGQMTVELVNDKVLVTGQAVIMLEGNFMNP